MASEKRHSYEEAKDLLMPLLLKHRDLHGHRADSLQDDAVSFKHAVLATVNVFQH